MLSIAEVSGLIAAAVMLVQYVLPAALVVILVKYVGTENKAVTWSVVNRTISTTIWPHFVRADSVSMYNVPMRAKIPSWALTLSAFLLVVASVLAPLGLYEEIVLDDDTSSVEFQYAKDTGPWGRATMPRPDTEFSRYCEVGLHINCPGQYQGVYMKEIEPGNWESVETDENSTINVTVPANITAIFSSATADRGNTVSGLFDIQYRRWTFNRNGIVNKGRPYVAADPRFIASLASSDRIHLVEGLIVDMRVNPGIGFRNHTIPIGLNYGGTWSEDITWIEPVTECADTNITIEMRNQNTLDSWTDNTTFVIVDRGAFMNLDETALESPAWNDNQTLDLFGRAHKAARMHNVMVASSMNISLPRDRPLPDTPVSDKSTASPWAYNREQFGLIVYGDLIGVGGAPPRVPDRYAVNSTIPFNNTYPDGYKKLLALNYSAITQVCRGYYEIGTTDNDWRANNITYPSVQCGFLLGAPLQSPNMNVSASTYTGVTVMQKNLYVCASAVRAGIKTVDFRYNGTGDQLENLEVLDVRDKVYADKQSQPLWASEHSFDRAMWFEPLWGLVDDRYENLGYDDGIYTLRAEKLWMPISPFLSNFQQLAGLDSLAGASGFIRRLGNIYTGVLNSFDYTGRNDFSLLERFQRLTHNATMASQVPMLMMTDGLAASLVGTKTAISSKYVEWPASLAVDDTSRGVPLARVLAYHRTIRYDLRYAIPGLIILAILLLALLWVLAILITSRSTLRTLQDMYNQTSTGRLATNLLRLDHSNPSQSTGMWVRGDGASQLTFGQISGTSPKKDYFCALGDGSPRVKEGSDNGSGNVGGADQALITVIPK